MTYDLSLDEYKCLAVNWMGSGDITLNELQDIHEKTGRIIIIKKGGREIILRSENEYAKTKS